MINNFIDEFLRFKGFKGSADDYYYKQAPSTLFKIFIDNDTLVINYEIMYPHLSSDYITEEYKVTKASETFAHISKFLAMYDR